MRRYEKFVLEVEGGEFTIRNRNITVYSTNYVNPLIPEGYKYVCGEWNNGFVIERCSDGSQFVWIPVGSLDSNGTLDGKHFSEKFGRRNDMNNEFWDYEFNEALNGERLEQLESVKKYGGFYISRYNISKSSEGKPQSVKGVMPWVDIKFDDAKKIASIMEGNNNAVKSHMPYSEEYDSIVQWYIQTGVIVDDSTKWGNYWNTKNSPKEVVETGSREEFYVNNICDFAGNVQEWTQEKNKSLRYVARGGCYIDDGDICPAYYREYYRSCEYYNYIGFRVTLYIK